MTDDEKSNPSRARRFADGEGAPVSLLVVDDEEANRDMLSRRLAKRGFQVTTASGGEEALEKIASTDFDLVLLDIMMPGIDGFEVLKRLPEKVFGDPPPVIMLSAKTQAENIVETLRLGAADYVGKPFDFPVLLARINTQIASRSSQRQLKEIRDNLQRLVDDKSIDLRKALIDLQLEESERKQAVIALRHREVQFKSLAENVPGVIFQCSLDDTRGLKFMYVSDGAGKRLGYSAEEFMDEGLNLLDRLIHPEDQDAFKRAFKVSARDMSVIDIETRFTGESGQEPWMHTKAAPRYSDDGSVVWDGISFDVTERKAAEEKQRISEIRYAAVINSTSEGYWRIDRDGLITEVNHALCEMLGYRRNEVIGKTSLHFADGKSRKTLAREVNSQRHKQRHRRYEIELRRKDGNTVPTAFSATSQMDASGNLTGSFAFVTDLTEIKRAEKEKTALEEDLRQAQKMQALGQLTGGIAHEFNNILSAVGGYAELALDKLSDSERTAYCLEEIMNATRHATTLTGQMLAFGRKQVLVPEIVLVHDVIENMKGLFKPLSREDHDLVLEIEDKHSFVRVDAGQLSQAILNLAINARDAMPGSGTLTIGSRTVYVDEEQAKGNESLSPGPYVTIYVSDTGDGIPADLLDKIFDPFFTTKEVGKGTGLGLSMVYGMVSQSGGAIEVDSAPEAGTTFTIYLAKLDEAEIKLDRGEPKEPQTDPAHLDAEGKSILLVEDDEKVREVITINLRDMGFNVFTASNGVEALSIYQESDGEIDILISDVEMPKMRGPELVKRLFENKANLGVILISGYSFQANNPLEELDGRYRTECRCLQKPVPPAKLSRTISQLLERAAT